MVKKIKEETFKEYSILKAHEDRRARTDIFRCSQCDKSFISEHYLKEHEKIHNGYKPFSCLTCHKNFKHANQLKEHEIAYHAGHLKLTSEEFLSYLGAKSILGAIKKPDISRNPSLFSCSECNKQFVTKSDLQTHTRAVLFYRCSTCLKKFTHSDELRIVDKLNELYNCTECADAQLGPVWKRFTK